MTGPSPTNALVEIRKYPNRRYYDKGLSRHLTLEQIRALIRSGADVRIVDSQTNADITSKVLTQIILEFDSPKLDLLTAPLLTQMIRVNDQVIKGFFQKFFDQALASFFAFQRQMEVQMRDNEFLPGLFPGLGAWSKATLAEAPSQGASKIPSSLSHPEVLTQSIRELQKEIKRLQQEMKRSPRRRKHK